MTLDPLADLVVWQAERQILRLEYLAEQICKSSTDGLLVEHNGSLFSVLSVFFAVHNLVLYLTIYHLQQTSSYSLVFVFVPTPAYKFTGPPRFAEA